MFSMSMKNFNVLIGRFALSENCIRLVNHKLFLNDSGMTVKPKSREITHKYIGYYLYCNQKIVYDCSRGTAQKNMDMDICLSTALYKLIAILSNTPCPSLVSTSFYLECSARATAELFPAVVA
jgi:hypothetical protein